MTSTSGGLPNIYTARLRRMFSRNVMASAAVLVAAICFSCSKPPPPPAPKGPTDADVHAEVDKARATGTFEALIAVAEKYPAFPSGKEAKRLAGRMLIAEAKGLATKCDEAAAKGTLARLAPLTLDDAELNESYDSMEAELTKEHSRCLAIKLDEEVKKAEAEWDWPDAFQRIANAKDIDGASLKQRRVDAIGRWKKFVDEQVRVLVAKKAIPEGKRGKLEASVDAEKLPAELAPDLEKLAPALQVALLTYGDLAGVELFEPLKFFWTYGPAKFRKLGTPKTIETASLPNALQFLAIAKGKLDGVNVLILSKITDPKLIGPDAVARFAAATLIVAEIEAKPYNTKK